ncbi:MAG: hypothetical protein HQM09_21095, partial [Candidatus Riflebacteria bacterium]|nr:hypothetical protein [Candidatus Riflebacteria bacterium]
MTGCFRWFKIAALVLLSLGCFAGWVILSLIIADSEKRSGKALSVPEKSMSEALRDDGPAWVRVRLECASGAMPLFCGTQKCLWLRSERIHRKYRSSGSNAAKIMEYPGLFQDKTIPMRMVGADG